MGADVIVGFALTGVALVTFLIAVWRQSARVDEVIRKVDTRRSPAEGEG